MYFWLIEGREQHGHGLSRDGEGGGHNCQQWQGEGVREGRWAVEALWQESGTKGRSSPLRAHGLAQIRRCKEESEP